MEEIARLAERVTFHNPDNGFCVLRLKVKGQRDLLTVVGHTLSVARGEWPELVERPRGGSSENIDGGERTHSPAVVIPVLMQHYLMLRRNLIYTGVTRGRALVVLIGQKKALGIAVRGRQTERRWSKLVEWWLKG